MPTYRFESYTINAGDRLPLKNGTRVDIWPKAADVLLLLVAARGDVVPKDEGDPRLDSLRHDPRFTAWHKA